MPLVPRDVQTANAYYVLPEAHSPVAGAVTYAGMTSAQTQALYIHKVSCREVTSDPPAATFHHAMGAMPDASSPPASWAMSLARAAAAMPEPAYPSWPVPEKTGGDVPGPSPTAATGRQHPIEDPSSPARLERKRLHNLISQRRMCRINRLICTLSPSLLSN